jgi:hypothetical protein
MKRCRLVIPDAGPFNSLWVADELDLLLKLDMPIVIVDAVYAEMTIDPDNYQKDRDVAAFVEGNRAFISIARTDTWQAELDRRAKGIKPKRNIGEIAITDYLSDENGLQRDVAVGEPVLLLFEDADIRVINKPPTVHLLSTVGLLRGMEEVGLIPSADAIIHRMLHPSGEKRENLTLRVLTDLPAGTDEPAAIGSTWIKRGT